MSHTVPLGLLDFLTPRRDATVADLRNNAIEAAILADRLGMRRVWVPEHHARGVPSTNPLTMIGVLASLTQQIRVGSAVSLIRIRDPHLLAEDIATAAHFAGSRLDVGVGRGDVSGPGTHVLDPLRKDADRAAADTRLLFELLEQGNAFIDPVPTPFQRWSHGAGSGSAASAAALGFHYCHALFLNPDPVACRAALDRHAQACPEATRAVAVGLVCSADARRVAEDSASAGVVINRAGSIEDGAALVAELLADPLVDEVVVTEQSTRAVDHHEALRGLVDHLRGPAAPERRAVPVGARGEVPSR